VPEFKKGKYSRKKNNHWK